MALPLIEKLFNSVEQRTNITTGQEFKTGKTIDGKEEYAKRINCGAGPNNGTRSVATGLSNVTYIKAEGIVTNGTMYFPLNNTRPVDRH